MVHDCLRLHCMCKRSHELKIMTTKAQIQKLQSKAKLGKLHEQSYSKSNFHHHQNFEQHSMSWLWQVALGCARLLGVTADKCRRQKLLSVVMSACSKACMQGRGDFILTAL